jgi:hypothetical protein
MASSMATAGPSAWAASAKDQLPAADGRRRGEGRAPDRFRAALAAREDVVEPGGAVPGAAPGWGLADGLRPPADTHGGGPVAGPARSLAVDRILIGAGAGGVEARIRIAHGPLAGSEIRLVAAADRGGVEAQLLTSPAGSSETLVAAMDEIRRRLRGKGIAPGAGPRGSSDGTRERRRGEPARPPR